MQFWQFFLSNAGTAKSVLSIRDLLAWAGFINKTAPAIGPMLAYAHGAYLTLLDGIGLGIGMPAEVESSNHTILTSIEQSLNLAVQHWVEWSIQSWNPWSPLQSFNL